MRHITIKYDKMNKYVKDKHTKEKKTAKDVLGTKDRLSGPTKACAKQHEDFF